MTDVLVAAVVVVAAPSGCSAGGRVEVDGRAGEPVRYWASQGPIDTELVEMWHMGSLVHRAIAARTVTSDWGICVVQHMENPPRGRER